MYLTLEVGSPARTASPNQRQVSLSITAFFCPHKHRTDGSIGLLHAERFRFERARPFLCITMFRVAFVGKRVEKFFVRVGPSTVLWRTRAFSGHTGRKVQIGSSGWFPNLFNSDEGIAKLLFWGFTVPMIGRLRRHVGGVVGPEAESISPGVAV